MLTKTGASFRLYERTLVCKSLQSKGQPSFVSRDVLTSLRNTTKKRTQYLYFYFIHFKQNFFFGVCFLTIFLIQSKVVEIFV